MVLRRILKYSLYVTVFLALIMFVLLIYGPRHKRFRLSEQDLRRLPLVFPISADIDFQSIQIPVTLSTQTRPFIVDTGTTHTVFDISYEDSLGEPIGERELVDFISGVTRTIQTYRFPAADLEGFPLKASRFTTLVDLSPISHYEDFDVGGLLGLDF